jgi:nitric oxide reductase activation protein
LERFVSVGLEKFRNNQEPGIRFLSLESKSGIDACSDLLVTVSLSQVRNPLNRYLRARTGIALSVRPLSDLPKLFSEESNGNPSVCSDGKFIYLPDEISRSESGVDYFRIKDFDETLDDTVKQRINAMSPQRSTRMGAAIRHATAQLEKVSAKVRLMIILGDGFPNDTGYKQEYAIEDTRRAIFEARSKHIAAKAVTVNLAGDPRLDDLYGSMHHTVISDVRELPDKLLRIYSALTR